MKIVVTSYNVLASSYAKPEHYPGVQSMHLDPAWRVPALSRAIVAMSADVYCLQEVEPQVFAAVSRALPEHRGEFAAKARGKPDGCATFIRRSLSSAPGRAHHFSDETGHVALFVTFELDGRRVGVANTHLKWGALALEAEAQVREVLAQIDARVPWIICGDFNAAADSPALELARTAGFVDAYRALLSPTCNSNQRLKRIDFILHGPELRSQPRPIRAIEAETPLPNDLEPSDHLAISAELMLKSDSSSAQRVL